MGDTVIDASIDSGFRTVKHSTSIASTMPDLPELQDASLGDIVRHLRTERGLTQFELGDELGKSQKWVSDIERGVYKHSTVETIRAIADDPAAIRTFVRQIGATVVLRAGVPVLDGI